MNSYAAMRRYRVAHEWRGESDSMAWSSKDWTSTLEIQQFAAWFAESDWDSPCAAWVDWTSRVRDTRVHAPEN